MAALLLPCNASVLTLHTCLYILIERPTTFTDMSSSVTSESIHTPTTAWESRSANEAMQRVADVMIAVTESSRQQFRCQQESSNAPFRPNGPGDLGWRASAPVLVSPILDDDVSPADSYVSRPSTAPSAIDSHRPAHVSFASPVSSHGTTTTSLPPAFVPGSMPNVHHSVVTQRNFLGDSEFHVQRPGTMSSPRIQISGRIPQRGLAPEDLEHPSEYPDLFEAARRIIFTQRGRRLANAMPPDINCKNRVQSEANEEPVFWARQSHIYQSQPLFEKVSLPELSFHQEASLVAVVSLYQILMFAGLSQAMAPALEIASSFTNLSTGQHSWFTAAYALALGVFSLPSARLGDTQGHKLVVIIGCLWFALWSLLAGFSIDVQKGGRNGTVYFCFCRAMQGIGPALCVPNGLSILDKSLSLGKSGEMGLFLYSIAAPLGFVIGAVMSSLFGINAAWEWSFFVLAAVCVSAAGLSTLILPSQVIYKTPLSNSIWVQLDMSGILFGVSGLALFSFAWNQAPAVGWQTPYTYFLLIIGVMFFGAFIYNEAVVEDPLLPLSAMNSSTNLVLACVAAGWGCFIIWAFYSFQLIEVLREWNPLLSSAGLVPVAVESFAVGLLLASLMPGVEVYWAMLVSIISFLAASVLMATAPPGQTYWANTFVSNLLVTLGMVMTTPLATMLLRDNLPEEHRGAASSLVLATSNYAISLALGMARTVEIQGGQGGQAILSGFRGAQYYGLGLGGLGVILALALMVNVVFIRSR